MAEARTKMEVLYQEGLADVDALVVRIEALEEKLPNIVKGIEDDLAGIVGQLVIAATQVKEAVRAETNSTVIGALGKARETIKVDASRARDDALMEIRQAVREAVSHPVGELVSQLNGAISRANGQQGRTFQHAVVAAVIGGVVAGAIVLGGSYFLLKDQAPAAATQSEEGTPAKLIKKGGKNG